MSRPVGTGFSQGTPDATSEADVALQFLGFFRNFVETFCLQGRKVYITGESYAGYYVPYIADAMLNSQNTDYYNVKGILMYNPAIGSGTLHNQSMHAPALISISANRFSSPFGSIRRLLESLARP